jgi:hypothetical protein
MLAQLCKPHKSPHRILPSLPVEFALCKGAQEGQVALILIGEIERL